jgi:hypothetical protein
MSTIYSPPFVSGAIGDKLYFYITGTSTPQNTYTDHDLNTAHANPVEADAEGNFEPIFFDPEVSAYRVDYKNSAGVSYPGYPVDNVPSSQNQATAYLVKGTAPTVELWETDAGADDKRWRIRADGEQFLIQQGTDAGVWTTLMTIPRGTVVQVSQLFSSGATLDISTLAAGQCAYIFKTATTIRNSDTTAAADPVLSFTSAPAGTYLTEGVLMFSSPSAADFKLAWPRISSVSGLVSVNGYDSLIAPVGGISPLLMSSTAQTLDTTVNITYVGTVYGVETATVGQALGPHWAQATSNAGNTSMLAGSFLKVTRLT